MRERISKRVVEKVEVGERDVFVWDTEVRGFGVKVTPNGRRIYIFQYRVPGKSAPERMTIGHHGDPWTADQARAEAERLRGDIKRGISPRERARQVAAEVRRAVTVAELCQRYLAEGTATKKASTLASDRGRIRRHILPLLGKRKVADITSADVRRFLTDVANGKTAADQKTGLRGRAIVTGGKGTATRTVGLLGGIFSFAVQEGIRPDNPVRGVRRFADRKCERYLSPAELARLGDALKAAEADGESPAAVAALRALILTGCRLSEILALRWAEVDIDRACLRLADSKTGAKVIVLGAPALQLFAGLPRQFGNPHVFPGDLEDRHLVGLPKIWARIRRRAGLDDVRIHDLRHTFASAGAGASVGLLAIGKLLGHRDPKTTARYAHLADDPARAAADRIAGGIADALDASATKIAVTLLRIPRRG